MQEYSKIRTFLIQQKNNTPLLPERGLKAQNKEYIMIPAIAYQVCLTKSNVPDNIITRTVVDLAKYYKRNGFEYGKTLDIIAERTKLERSLVKAILKRYINTLDAESNEENDGLIQEFYYALYDPIMKRCFPDLIPKEEYDQNTYFEETKPAYIDLSRELGIFSFTLSISDSRRYRCNVLNYNLNSKDIPNDPKNLYNARIINRYLRDPKSKLEYTGVSETVGLICPCFISMVDLSKIHVMSPMGKGTMDHLLESIKTGIKVFPDLNTELSACVQEMDKARKSLLDKTETFIEAADESKKRVLINFPGINQYPDVLSRTAEVEAIHKSYINALDSEKIANLSNLNKMGRDFVVAFYTLLEKIFAISVVKNYPHEKVKQMEVLAAPLKGHRSNDASYFAGIAEQIGLDDTDMTVDFFQSPEGKVKIKTLNAILSASFTGGKFPESLPELVVAHFIQAAAFENHPFRMAIMKCPRLLRTVKLFLQKRNAAKHGNAIQEVDAFVMKRRDINEMLVLAESMIDVLLVPRASFSELNRNEADINNRQNALIKATEELKNYSALSDEREVTVYETAKNACYRFHYKDPEYISECSNLLSMLMVLLDEMNLAHPEQYFADLLSKFEESRNTDRDPSYEIALGAGERPEMLNIGRNVLWTGTMNEDETTKGLSDKVIDRSMLITFPCPKELYGRNTNKLEKPQLTLSHARWELWKQSALHSEDDRIIDLINDRKKMIEQINIEMSEMGRNLGHRVWQSIQNYILNYPLVIAAGKCQGDMTDAVQQAFCDALAFKMMPKLRGLEVNGYNERHLEKIKQYLNEGASELSTDFDKACSMTSEIFQWNSAEFMEL